MLRKVSISWIKQRSGSYALKGITISEDDHAYDSSITFRDEDAEWVTTTLNAEAHVEVARAREDERDTARHPKWAGNKGETSIVEEVPAIAAERAGATLLRHFLKEMMDASNAGSAEGNAKLLTLARNAGAILRTTDCGTYYSVDEAIAILTKGKQKPYTSGVSAQKRTP